MVCKITMLSSCTECLRIKLRSAEELRRSGMILPTRSVHIKETNVTLIFRLPSFDVMWRWLGKFGLSDPASKSHHRDLT